MYSGSPPPPAETQDDSSSSRWIEAWLRWTVTGWNRA